MSAARALHSSVVLRVGMSSALVALTWALDAQTTSYRRVADWAKLPADMKWAAVTGAEPGSDGSLYVLHRCFENSCADRAEAPIMVFDREGKFLRAWGEGMFVLPHGFHLDREGNVWATDAQGREGKGHQVFKFSRDGKLLMTLGKAGIAGDTLDTFNQPTDVAVGLRGDVYVADGHRRDPHASGGDSGNNRILKFSRDGRFIKMWGQKGTGPGEFREPHSLAIDSRGRLFVADRVNNRIQVFDDEGIFLAEWKQFGRPSGIFIDRSDRIYVADSESGTSAPNADTGLKKGIRIGSAIDGKVAAFIEDIESATREPSGAEGVGADASGNVYGAVVRRRLLEKFVPVGPIRP